MFSILIPTWNNLDFVKLCVESIKKNSFYKHQIILHINEGTDGTLQWVKDNGLDYTYTNYNSGVCYAVNEASMLATQQYIVYINDDMYVCPNWDKYLVEEIEFLGTDCFMLSSTMIEPVVAKNNCVIFKNFGTSVSNFQEENLLREYENFKWNDWYGSTWPPTIVSKKYWELIGGYSIEFSPGMSSDNDFSMKMWKAGCRIFKGVAKSKVYHFQTKSTSRIKKNDGRKQFLFKWGINQSTFSKYFLKRGEPYNGPLTEPNPSSLRIELIRAWIKQKIKKNLYIWESD